MKIRYYYYYNILLINLTCDWELLLKSSCLTFACLYTYVHSYTIILAYLQFICNLIISSQTIIKVIVDVVKVTCCWNCDICCREAEIIFQNHSNDKGIQFFRCKTIVDGATNPVYTKLLTNWEGESLQHRYCKEK